MGLVKCLKVCVCTINYGYWLCLFEIALVFPKRFGQIFANIFMIIHKTFTVTHVSPLFYYAEHTQLLINLNVQSEGFSIIS